MKTLGSSLPPEDEELELLRPTKEDKIELVDPEDFKSLACIDNVRMIEWVADNLRVTVEPDDAPNSRAWGMLLWARLNEDKFYTQILKAILPSRPNVEKSTEEGEIDDGGVLDIIKLVQTARDEAAS